MLPLLDAIADGAIDTKMAGNKLRELQDRQEVAKIRLAEIHAQTKKIYLTEEQVAVLLEHLLQELKKNRPDALRLIFKKMVLGVVVGISSIETKIVLACVGAGEPHFPVCQKSLLYISLREPKGKLLQKAWEYNE